MNRRKKFGFFLSQVSRGERSKETFFLFSPTSLEIFNGGEKERIKGRQRCGSAGIIRQWQFVREKKNCISPLFYATETPPQRFVCEKFPASDKLSHLCELGSCSDAGSNPSFPLLFCFPRRSDVDFPFGFHSFVSKRIFPFLTDSVKGYSFYNNFRTRALCFFTTLPHLSLIYSSSVFACLLPFALQHLSSGSCSLQMRNKRRRRLACFVSSGCTAPL